MLETYTFIATIVALSTWLYIVVSDKAAGVVKLTLTIVVLIAAKIIATDEDILFTLNGDAISVKKLVDFLFFIFALVSTFVLSIALYMLLTNYFIPNEEGYGFASHRSAIIRDLKEIKITAGEEYGEYILSTHDQHYTLMLEECDDDYGYFPIDPDDIESNGINVLLFMNKPLKIDIQPSS